ncbi:hypothetical protein [Streptomyces sp. KAU_LT]|uniref:hypothetical protein n=1 Tax=Streptomyces sp. KAU_LT TaxID=3046669 RepID=UPI0024B6E1F2|nr:hypothetical protein [Streptomyces sp. KAU_LT]MDI9831683.1 hypothetical protein [Streptomyces sp. KAU_LT]
MTTEGLLEHGEHAGPGTTSAARLPRRTPAQGRAATPRTVPVMPLWERRQHEGAWR